MDIELTEEQNEIRKNVCDWLHYSEPGSRMAISGYAGTGKTTLVNNLINTFAGTNTDKSKTIAVCAPTGKASSVLQRKLFAANVPLTAYDCNTMHSMLFIPKEECDVKTFDTNLAFRVKNPLDLMDKHYLIIIDEASMLQNDMYEQLSIVDTPILIVGDPGQLPPVGAEMVPLLLKTQYSLKTVHRQALGNPIIRLATAVRRGAKLAPFMNNKLMVTTRVTDNAKLLGRKFTSGALNPENMMLTGRNTNRVSHNMHIRNEYGFAKHDFPQKGERIVCLSNDRTARMMNGQLFFVIDSSTLDDDFFIMVITPEDQYGNQDSRKLTIVASRVMLNNPDNGALSAHRRDYRMLRRFKDYAVENMSCNTEQPGYFDFGYCLSVHKSQGSEWNSVLFYNDELFKTQDPAGYRQWLYTGITRAKNSLAIVI